MANRYPPVLVEALRLPGALLVKTDPEGYRNRTDVAYWVGVEQESASKPFANVFEHGREVVLYFRHEAGREAALYADHGGAVSPSEVASKYWSKVAVGTDPALASDLLRGSYERVLASCSTKGREAVRAAAAEENRFLEFHEGALGLVRRDGSVTVKYEGMPILSAGMWPVAKFTRNALHVCHYEGRRKAERWEVVPASAWREWAGAMAAAVERRAG